LDYLALEDNARRLNDRAAKLMPYTFPARSWPANLHLEPEWPRADAGGLAKIEEWLDSHPDARLVVVDVRAMFRPLMGTNKKRLRTGLPCDQVATGDRVTPKYCDPDRDPHPESSLPKRRSV